MKKALFVSCLLLGMVLPFSFVFAGVIIPGRPDFLMCTWNGTPTEKDRLPLAWYDTTGSIAYDGGSDYVTFDYTSGARTGANSSNVDCQNSSALDDLDKYTIGVNAFNYDGDDEFDNSVFVIFFGFCVFYASVWFILKV